MKNIDRLHHIDYAQQIYSGHIKSKEELTFQKRGFIYGPIRISADQTGSVGKMLVKPTTEHSFVQDKIAIFFVRDPRDILVSSYYSFGFTHGLSRVDELRELQEAERKIIRNQTLDEYVLQSVNRQIDLFNILHNMSTACERSLILRYEDMIDDFDTFTGQLMKYISLRDDVVREIYQKSRPNQREDMNSHRRSGQVQGFRCNLKEETIEALNRKLARTLALFGYRA